MVRDEVTLQTQKAAGFSPSRRRWVMEIAGGQDEGAEVAPLRPPQPAAWRSYLHGTCLWSPAPGAFWPLGGRAPEPEARGEAAPRVPRAQDMEERLQM